jgi:predicted Fe-S protein YdhL (DUF1289 family)
MGACQFWRTPHALSPLGDSRSISAPRPIDGRRRQAGLLAHGFSPDIAFPDPRIQWPSMQGTPFTVAGAARVLHPSSLFIPVRGTCHSRLQCLNRFGESMSGPERECNRMTRTRDLAAAVAMSPCIKVCKLDRSSMCTGCGRLLSEIAAWSQMTLEQRSETCERAQMRLSEAVQVASPARTP